MSTHPNVLLLAVFTPEDLSRKTMRNILDEYGEKNISDPDIMLGKLRLHPEVMEQDYDESWQVSAKEGDLVFIHLATYGYGEKLSWDEFVAQKEIIDAWAKEASVKYHCEYRLYVSANYW